jgi:hypothetical protein
MMIIYIYCYNDTDVNIDNILLIDTAIVEEQIKRPSVKAIKQPQLLQKVCIKVFLFTTTEMLIYCILISHLLA